MGFKIREPNLGLFRTLLILSLLFGLVIPENPDFEFADKSVADSLKDDEDFLRDYAGSGDVSGEGPLVPSGKPEQFRVTINFSELEYTAEMSAAGRNIQNLPIVIQIRTSIENLLRSLPGSIRIRIVELRPGSLLVTFDVDTDGQASEEEIRKLLTDALNRGQLPPFRISTDSFEFRSIREDQYCPPEVGRTPQNLPGRGINLANLMTNNAFPCDGYITSWRYYRTKPFGVAYIGVWRQHSDTEYVLVSQTELPVTNVGLVTVPLAQPILVRSGDFLGVLYPRTTEESVIAEAAYDDNAVPDKELYQTYRMSLYDGDVTVGTPFGLSDFDYSELRATLGIQAVMDYTNVPGGPIVTTAAPIPCSAGEFTCRNGDCVDGRYRCDGQYDCFDGSDEDACPEIRCPPGEFQCANKRQCVPVEFRCNSVPECDDSSDELNCGPAPVFMQSFRDGSEPTTYLIVWNFAADQAISRFIIRYRLVDVESVRDAEGNYIFRQALESDYREVSNIQPAGDFVNQYQLTGLRPDSYYQTEVIGENSAGQSEPTRFIFKTARAVAGCGREEFQCRSGECIRLTAQCDNFPDCQDASDEDSSICSPERVCNEGQEPCIDEDDNLLRCMSRFEFQANGCRCTAGQFRCADRRQCVSAGARCNGVQNCKDGSDELNCGCRSDQFQCNDRSCVPLNFKCDGIPQCEDRSDEIGCPPPQCPSGDFQCTNPDQLECVDIRLKCDGVEDCRDGSDERNCPCTDAQFTCADGNCVEARMRCDGVPQCEDSSDEIGCPRDRCPEGNYRCANRDRLECIDERLRCDGFPDCSDSSDERGCPCTDSQFTCNDGNCVELRMRCDRIAQCEDGSDEFNCPFSCGREEFRCRSVDECIPTGFRCDGSFDCSDRSDEYNCTCNENQFRCGDGLCIDIRRRCDRSVDCADRSDELACPCRSGEFQCRNGDCISQARRCDGRSDCSDGTDESGCRPRCRSNEFQCRSGECIDARLRCNRVRNCRDASDESNCPTRRPCPDGYFQCGTGHCLGVARVCDGRSDCPDGSDEQEGCSTTPAPTPPQPIVVSVSPRNLQIREGVEAVFQCVGIGLPQSAVLRWSRGNAGLPLQSSEVRGELRIPVARVADSGDYVCTAVGVGVPGTYRATARLTVVGVGPQPNDTDRPCGRDEAVCRNGQCIRREYRCDGEQDCRDGSDELDCSSNNFCEPNEFQCPSGQCVMKIWRCDGENDCADGFDERNCQPKRPNDPCGTDEFQCVSADQCIPLAYQCDKEIDCQDRSDEIGCAAPVITVPPVAQIEVEIGGTFTIICEAVGVPTPLIVWRLNWGNIPTGERVTTISEAGRGSLTIRDTRYEDAGAYTCEAINNRGSIFAIPDAIVIVRRAKGPCNPPLFNNLAVSAEECVRCFCFGQSLQCFSSDLQVSRIALAGQIQLINRDTDTTVEQAYVEFLPNTREYQVEDIFRVLPQGSYYWSLPREFLGERLKSYGGELKYTIFYEIDGRVTRQTVMPDVIIEGNGISLYYKGRTIPSAGAPTSLSVPLIPSEWERSEGPRRGDTPVAEYASREDLMMVLQNVTRILIRGIYDNTQTVSRIGGVLMTTAVDYPTEFGQAYLVEECTCPTGYTGLSCQQCATGFYRVRRGQYLGECAACSCNGHSNDCDPVTGQCLNCLHNTYGSRCELCREGYYGDATLGNADACQECPCPLTIPSNQFSRSCFLDSDRAVTCRNCPVGYEGRRCERCAEGYVGDPTTPGSSCTRVQIEDYCDPRGAVSTRPDPITGRCNCKENTIGDRCDRCKANSFYLTDAYAYGCVNCFCMGVSTTCQSTSWNRAQIGVSFTGDSQGVRLTDADNIPVDDQSMSVDAVDRELVYRNFPSLPDVAYYWSLPSRFLGDKVTSYGGSLRFEVRYRSRFTGGAIDTAVPLVSISGNDITFVYRTNTQFRQNQRTPFSVVFYEQNWVRTNGEPATREHMLMVLADLKSILIRATYEDQQQEAGLRDVTLDVAEDRFTGQDRAYPVEQCVCPVGYRGLSCEDCDNGYTRSGGGLYLGLCEPCQCNGHSSDCDPETGVCRNCLHNTAGEHCESCAVGYYGDASRGTRNDCQKCPCPLTEQPNQFSPTCILDRDGQVTCTACPAGHTGRRCETCLPGYTGNPLRPGDYCKESEPDRCDCDSRGTVPNTRCDSETNQCRCKPYVQGLRCERCQDGYFYLDRSNPQGCLECFCSGITDQCSSSNYYRETIRPQLNSDGSHNFVLLNRRMSNEQREGFSVDTARNQVTFTFFEGVQQERESLFFQLPPKFRGDQVTSYGGTLRFTLDFTADQTQGRPYRDVDLEIISNNQQLRLYHLLNPSPQEGRSQTYEILLREESFRDLRSNSAPTRETFMTILSNIEGILIRATHHENMKTVSLRDVSMDIAVPSATALGPAPMVENCRCPEGYTGLSCEKCAPGYLRSADGSSGLGRCTRCNCNGHSTSCDPETGRCLNCQHNTEGDRCERCVAGYYGDPTSGTPTDCRVCPCPLTNPGNQFSRTCFLDQDNRVTCDRCAAGYTGRDCGTCAQGYSGNPREVGGSCRTSGDRPEVTVNPIRLDEPAGSTVVFRCVVGGQGPFNVVWSRLDSRPLPDRATVSPRYDLTIRNLVRDDTGRYVCSATNAYGVTRGTVELTVQSGPSPIRVQIDTTRVEVQGGRTARFVCTVVGQPRDITYILSWSKQGAAMPAKAVDQNGVLIIPNVNPSDAGNYVCTGSDMRSTDEKMATLIVIAGEEGPTVRIEPRYQTVDEGQSVRFECIATGSPAPTIEWNRGNRAMSPNAIITPDGVFRIPSVRKSDESDYYCRATNDAGTTEVRTILYVNEGARPERPTVVVRQTKVVALIGTTVNLECYVEDPRGRVTLFWSRQGGLPAGSDQDNGVLTLTNVQPSYSGNYICTGTTDTGVTNTAITRLDIEVGPANEIPTARVEPERLTIPMGTTGTLRCIVTGNPAPTITWLRSRDPLAENHKVNGEVLRITEAMMEDRGIYVCRAENVAGVDQDWAVVEVERRMRPKIELYPESVQTIQVGGSALFQCRVMDGDPPPTITWARTGNEPLTSRTDTMENGVIMFKQATQEEQGSYICTATNDMGTITATATLLVEGPPTIRIVPSRTIYAIIGQQVRMECIADGEPTPNVYWIDPSQPRRGDIQPEELPLGFPTGDGTAILQIESVNRENQGTYTCVAENTGGRSTDRVQLVVSEGGTAGVRIRGPGTLAVFEGQSVELTCEAQELSNPSLRWRRRNANLPPGTSVRNGVLTIPQFRAEYAGEYLCSAQTPQGNFEATVIIIVSVAPRLTISPQRISARAGEPVYLRCSATGTGPFDIEWTKVDGNLNPRAVEREGVLEINQITRADAGQYRCTVTNQAGTNEGYAIVEVAVPPSVVVPQRDISTQENRVVELRCEVSGTPTPQVRWEKDGGELPRQHRIQNGILTIYNVQREDAGRYICSAISESGSARDYAYLRVETGPDINGGSGNVDTQIVDVGDRVEMDCIVTGTPLPTIRWSREDGPLPRDSIVNGGILIIPQAKVEDAGTYTCTAVNEAGSITSKVNLYIRAQPLISVPQNTMTASLGSSVSMTCDAHGFPSPEITWYRKDGDMPSEYTIVDGDLKIPRVRPEDRGTYYCSAQNQYGQSDLPVSLRVGALVPHFPQNPKSYITYPPLNDVYLEFDILLSLKPESTEGMVLYNGQFNDGGGDFVCFGLNEGYPEFRFDVGSGPAVIRGNRTLRLNEWHTVQLKRNRKEGTLVVDDQPPYTGVSPGRFQGLDLLENMYLGSVPDFQAVPKAASVSEGFVGSISEVKIKGINLDLGAEALEIVGIDQYNACQQSPCQNRGSCIPANTRYGYECLCSQGYAGTNCEMTGERCYEGACGPEGRCYNLEGGQGFRCVCPLGKAGTGCQVDLNIVNPFFNKTSFISYPPAEGALFQLSVYMEFKPRTLDDGILLYNGIMKDGSGDFFSIVLRGGYLEFRFDTGSGPAVIRSRSPIRVNEWTRVTATRKNREGTLVVNDDDPVTARPTTYYRPYNSYLRYYARRRYRRGTSPGSTVGLNLKLPLYLGGYDPTISVSSQAGATQGFTGCIAELTVNGRTINLIEDAIESANVKDCGERRLCDREPCENGGQCEDLPGPDYRCLCPSTHQGRNCDVEINICVTNSPCQHNAPCSITDEGYRCDCPLGYAGVNCHLRVDLDTRFFLNGDGFIELDKDRLPHSNTQERETISMVITTTQSNGLIFWHGERSGQPLRGADYFSIGVRDGYLEFSYELGSGPALFTSRERVDDGQPHTIVISRLGRGGSLTVDSGDTITGESPGFLQMLNTKGNIFLGGVSLVEDMTGGKFRENFSGCIENIIIQGKGPLNLPQDAVLGYNITPCQN